MLFLSLGAQALVARGPVQIESGATKFVSTATFNDHLAVSCFQDDGNSDTGVCVAIERKQAPASYDFSVDTAVMFETGQTEYVSVATLDTLNGVVCYKDKGDSGKGKCCHIEQYNHPLVDDQPMTVETPVEFETNNAAEHISVAVFDSTNAVVCYSDTRDVSSDPGISYASGSGTKGFAKCVHIGASGRTLTMQPYVYFTRPVEDLTNNLGTQTGQGYVYTGYEVTNIGVSAFDSTNAIMCYIDVTDSSKGKCTLVTRSGTTITTYNTVTTSYSTTAPVFESDTTAVPTVATFDATNAIVCWADGGSTPTAYKGYCAHVGLSGTTLTYGTPVVIQEDILSSRPAYPWDGSDGSMSVTTEGSATAVVCYQDAMQQKMGLCTTLTLSGTTLSSGTSVTFESGATKYISVASFGTSHNIACYQDDDDVDRGKCSYIYSGLASVYGDPHLRLAHGGRTDFRGTHGKVYNMLSAPNISFSVETSNSHFYQDYGKQLVHGSHFRKAYFMLRTATGETLKVASYAHDCPYHVFKSYEPFKVFTQASRDSLHAANADVFWSERGRVTVRASGWEVNVTCRTLYKPISGTNRMTQDITIRTLDDDPMLLAKYGKANVHLVSPHGIIGQSFTPGMVLKDGRLDNYTNVAEVTTSAQAEGAIEGVYTDYEVKAWSPHYIFSRFDAKPNVTSASSSVRSAGSLYAASEDPHSAVEVAAA